MVNLSSQKILTLLLIAFVFACTQQPARIVDNKNKTYQKKTFSTNQNTQRKTYSKSTPNEELKEQDLSETNSESAKNKEEKTKRITVEKGQTLYAISQKTGVSISDLIKFNNLSAPYSLKSGDQLNIPSPNYHIVKTGETLYAISRLYQMKIDQLIAINDLKPPYAVKVGSKIRIANFSTDSAIANEEEKQPNKEAEKEYNFTPLAKIADKNNRFSWPIKGEIISKFGPKSGGLYNDGINIKAKSGAEVKAAEDGAVAYVGNELKGYGNLIIVKHSEGWITAYAHLEKTLVKRGEKVERGQKIATVGSSGNVNSPQLYFGLRKGRDAVNPQNHLH